MSDAAAERLVRSLATDRILHTRATGKAGVLDTLMDVLAESPHILSPDEFRKGILDREALMSTGIGLGIGVPHTRLASITDLVTALAINDRPLADYGAIDNQPVQLVFMVAGRPDQQRAYIQLLAGISAAMKDGDVRDRLLRSGDAATAMEVLSG